MNPDQVWDVVNAQRRALVDLLPALSEEEWRRPSLCNGPRRLVTRPATVTS